MHGQGDISPSPSPPPRLKSLLRPNLQRRRRAIDALTDSECPALYRGP